MFLLQDPPSNSVRSIMKKLCLLFIFICYFLPFAQAEIKDYFYDSKEIYVHVKKDHLTVVVFPEPINSVIRGFGADSYVIKRKSNQLNTLELMPVASEIAEITVSGVSGEEYILRFVGKDDFYTKLVIHRLGPSLDKNEDKTIFAKMDFLPEAIRINKESKSQTVAALKPSSEIPSPLNLRITLKGNDLPLKIYLSTISKVTHYNIITTPEIDSQKTSINVDNIEVWRALKSLLYKFSWGFKVSKEDLIITSLETRIFNIRIPAGEQSFMDQTSNETFAQNQSNYIGNTNANQQIQDIKVGTKIFYENSVPKLSLWSDLENNIKSLITSQVGSYSISKSSSTITVTDKPGVLDKIAEIIETTNEILGRQQTFEIQINIFTHSLNCGVYMKINGTPKVGEYAATCLTREIVEYGISRNYLAPGNCVTGTVPVLKMIKSIPGDHFLVKNGSLKLYGQAYPIKSKDSDGRPLKSFYKNKEGILNRGEYILLGNSSEHSWDSRYFGPVGIEFLLKPLWIFELVNGRRA